MFPHDVTRAFINIISNAIYATLRQQSKSPDKTYEPTLSIATADLGDVVGITIRDNGEGIGADIKEKIFDPFFTTKPPGEGTGLGLSLSHDIIVKQHGGQISFDSQPGEFAEFRVVIPRSGRRFS